MLIESLEQWEAFARELDEDGFRLWQWQFRADSPEGFHALFMCLGQPDREVVTYDKAVEIAIVKYRPPAV